MLYRGALDYTSTEDDRVNVVVASSSKLGKWKRSDQQKVKEN